MLMIARAQLLSFLETNCICFLFAFLLSLAILPFDYVRHFFDAFRIIMNDNNIIIY